LKKEAAGLLPSSQPPLLEAGVIAPEGLVGCKAFEVNALILWQQDNNAPERCERSSSVFRGRQQGQCSLRNNPKR
jgi:hypothetical protein